MASSSSSSDAAPTQVADFHYELRLEVRQTDTKADHDFTRVLANEWNDVKKLVETEIKGNAFLLGSIIVCQGSERDGRVAAVALVSKMHLPGWKVVKIDFVRAFDFSVAGFANLAQDPKLQRQLCTTYCGTAEVHALVAVESIFHMILRRTPPSVSSSYQSVPAGFQYETGDVMLFAGNYESSVQLRQIQWSCYSHAAMVVRRADGLHVFQSTSHPGVTLDDFEKEINKYDGAIVVRKLRISAAERARIQPLVDEFVQGSLGSQYPPKWYMALAWLFRTIKLGLPQRPVFFCSQLVAACFLAVELLQPGEPAWTCIPKSFEPEETTLHFKPGFALDAPLIVKWKPAVQQPSLH